MKSISALLCAVSALALGGCVTPMSQGMQTEEALAIRQVISKQCVVGRITAGQPKSIIYIREGVESMRTAPPALKFRHRPDVDTIVIYSVREASDGWKIYDATSGKVRDNFYFQQKTGAFACSENEWLSGGGARHQGTRFQRTGTSGFAIGQ